MVHPGKKCRLALEHLEARDCPTAGMLDPTFGGTGIVQMNVGSGPSSWAQNVAQQPDGKLVVFGNAEYPVPNQVPSTTHDFALARLNDNGTLDTSFGVGGKVVTNFTITGHGNNQTQSDDVARKIVIQPNGAILVSGTSDGKLAMARYLSTGALDTTFDGDGKLVLSGVGNIAISGESQFTLLTDGKILFCCPATITGSGKHPPPPQYGIALVRFNANGSLDTTFDGDGVGPIALLGNSSNSFNRLEMQGSQFVLAGAIAGVPAIARFNANGTLDTTFGGGDGFETCPQAVGWGGLAVQANRIVVSARMAESFDPDTPPIIACYTGNGVLDTTFGSNGFVIERGTPQNPVDGYFTSVKIQSNGSIVVVGAFVTPPYDLHFLAARYDATGVLDQTFNGGVVITDPSPSPSGFAKNLTIQADGKIVSVGHWNDSNGNARFCVVRYLGDNNLSAVSTPSKPTTQSLTASQAQPLLTEAIARWRSAGFNVASLSNINLRIADLPGTTLGQAQGNTITLDSNAAGWGWFVDKTPRNDLEFRLPGNQGERGKMDLLSVLMHETGHLLGRSHSEHGVMAETLAAGMRSAPSIATDAAFLAELLRPTKRAHHLAM